MVHAKHHQRREVLRRRVINIFPIEGNSIFKKIFLMYVTVKKNDQCLKQICCKCIFTKNISLKGLHGEELKIRSICFDVMARTNVISINSWNPISIVENMFMCEQDIHKTSRKILHKNR
jgi:hypothetical protein